MSRSNRGKPQLHNTVQSWPEYSAEDYSPVIPRPEYGPELADLFARVIREGLTPEQAGRLAAVRAERARAYDSMLESTRDRHPTLWGYGIEFHPHRSGQEDSE